MITAIVLIKTSVDRIPEIAESIAALDSVSEVFSVTGTYDLIAMVRVATPRRSGGRHPGQHQQDPGRRGDGHARGVPHVLAARPGGGVRDRPGRLGPSALVRGPRTAVPLQREDGDAVGGRGIDASVADDRARVPTDAPPSTRFCQVRLPWTVQAVERRAPACVERAAGDRRIAVLVPLVVEPEGPRPGSVGRVQGDDVAGRSRRHRDRGEGDLQLK